MVKRLFIFCFWACLVHFSSAQVFPAFPELIDFPKVRDLAMNSTGTEIWLTIQTPLEEWSAIATMKQIDGRWSAPELMSFSGQWTDMEPFLSPDGLHLYFVSNRPLHPDSTKAKDMDIWVVDRTTDQDTWSVPRHLGPPVNTMAQEFYPAVADNGNLYFTRKPEDPDRLEDLYFSSWSTNGYSDPVPFGEAINSPGYEYNAYIAPDESYLLFGAYNRPDGFGSGDLYISHRGPAGQWQAAKNLGPDVNGPAMDYCPFVHAGSQTLYFTSRRSKAASQAITTAAQFLELAKQYENGYSRLYRIPIGTLLLPDQQK